MVVTPTLTPIIILYLKARPEDAVPMLLIFVPFIPVVVVILAPLHMKKPLPIDFLESYSGATAAQLRALVE